MRQLRQQTIERWSRRKKWQWGLPFAVILSGLAIWGIYKTESLAEFLGLENDETIIAIEEDNTSGQPEYTTVVEPGKSLWDMMELLVIPLSLLLLGAWFQNSQGERESNETREEVLQLYFDRISMLLIDKNLMAIASKKNTIDAEQKELLEISIDIIKARTPSILRFFDKDAKRRSSAIRFLAETDTISRLRINLSSTNLSRVHLGYTNLSGANLSNSNISTSNLFEANLHGANLSKVNLSRTFMPGANLSKVNLFNANLSGADLFGADLSDANLFDANLSGARGVTKEQLSEARLCNTKLPKGIDLDPDRDCE